jgi:DNA-binding GntR family transcriptional regulator
MPVAGRLKRVRADKSTRLADTVYMQLMEAILKGRLPPGTIVAELALSRQLGVSRTPVHDALRQLGKDGLIEQKSGRRAVVVAVSRDDVQDIFQMRRLLEAEAARCAATRIDRPTLAQLRAAAEKLAKGQRNRAWLERWADFDEQCHAAIARASGSPRLAHDIARYRLLHRGLNKLATTIDDLDRALEEHLRILDALDRRDPPAAAQAMEEHLREWQTYFVHQMSANGNKV